VDTDQGQHGQRDQPAVLWWACAAHWYCVFVHPPSRGITIGGSVDQRGPVDGAAATVRRHDGQQPAHSSPHRAVKGAHGKSARWYRRTPRWWRGLHVDAGTNRAQWARSQTHQPGEVGSAHNTRPPGQDSEVGRQGRNQL